MNLKQLEDMAPKHSGNPFYISFSDLLLLMLVFFVILFCHNVRCIELLLNFCKIEVRHILFQKIGFTIF